MKTVIFFESVFRLDMCGHHWLGTCITDLIIGEIMGGAELQVFHDDVCGCRFHRQFRFPGFCLSQPVGNGKMQVIFFRQALRGNLYMLMEMSVLYTYILAFGERLFYLEIAAVFLVDLYINTPDQIFRL